MSKVDCAGSKLKAGDIVKIEGDKEDSIYAIYCGGEDFALQTPAGTYVDCFDNVINTKSFFTDNKLDDVYQAQTSDVIVERAGHAPLITSDDGGRLFAYLCRYAAPKDFKKQSRTPGSVTAPKPPAPRQLQTITDRKGNVVTPGDVIVFDCGKFKHWAIYVGDGEIVHNTAKGVKKEHIMDATGEWPFIIDHSLDKSFSSFPKDAVVASANARVGMCGFNVRDFNCESFVNEVVTAQRKSKQADAFYKKKTSTRNPFAKKTSSATASVGPNADDMYVHATGGATAVAQHGDVVKVAGPGGFPGLVIQNGEIPEAVCCAICHKKKM